MRERMAMVRMESSLFFLHTDNHHVCSHSRNYVTMQIKPWRHLERFVSYRSYDFNNDKWMIPHSSTCVITATRTKAFTVSYVCELWSKHYQVKFSVRERERETEKPNFFPKVNSTHINLLIAHFWHCAYYVLSEHLHLSTMSVYIWGIKSVKKVYRVRRKGTRRITLNYVVIYKRDH